MSALMLRPARPQAELDQEPYDRWILPDGRHKAEFRRDGDGFIVRFLDEADFIIDRAGDAVAAYPVPGFPVRQVETLFANAIEPLLGNHEGGLFLHGSAVVGERAAIAFLGASHSGKTTLAAAFARAGHEVLTEDVIELLPAGGTYQLLPKASPLRLFSDSAEALYGGQASGRNEKSEIGIAEGVLFASKPCTLSMIYLLGAEPTEEISIEQVDQRTALTCLLQQSFILDVEDKHRLKNHFDRLAGLAARVPCALLNFPRDYSVLPEVLSAVTEHLEGLENNDDA